MNMMIQQNAIMMATRMQYAEKVRAAKKASLEQSYSRQPSNINNIEEANNQYTTEDPTKGPTQHPNQDYIESGNSNTGLVTKKEY